MKKITSLLLLISMLLSMIACSRGTGSKDDPDNDPPGGEIVEKPDNTPVIVVPEYKDYGRESVNFDELVYSRPNIQAVLDAFLLVTEVIEADEKSLDEQIDQISSLEEGLTTVRTMYSIAEIQRSKDSTIEFWQTEYEYISTNYPRVTQSVEDLIVACAKSEKRTDFEESYFGYSLEEYADGGIYTDEVVALMEKEAELESEYSSLSTSNVEINFKSVNISINWSGTADEVIEMAKEHFKDDEESFERVLMAINLLYEKERAELEKPIYIELIKVRRLIADELGYDSYSELAYESMGYDYTPDDMMTLIKDIGKYASPVASDLEYTVFGGYFQNNVQPILDETILINTLYNVYSGLGEDYKDAYSYMLQHKLYDIKRNDDNRFAGAFTTYLESNNSPYVFVSTSGFLRDYLTLSHEFGHFLDGYVNYGADDSLAVSEISSQALELLTILKLKNEIHSKDYQYLEYYSMFSFLNNVLLVQSFYSAFEHMVYELEYDQITENNLSKTVEEAFSLIYGEEISIDGDLGYVTITHTVLYPFYVEAYVTSGLVSLDIFFSESYRTGTAGDGFKLYEALINRTEYDLTFSERLELAGLESPFAECKVKRIANNIYFQIIGKDYYKPCNGGVGEV